MLHNGQRVGLGREGKAGEVPRCFPFKKKNREREREKAKIVLTTEKRALLRTSI